MFDNEELGECGQRAKEFKHFIDHGALSKVAAVSIGNKCNVTVSDPNGDDDLLERECCLLKQVMQLYKEALPSCWSQLKPLYKREEVTECGLSSHAENLLAEHISEPSINPESTFAHDNVPAAIGLGIPLLGTLIMLARHAYTHRFHIAQRPLLE